MIEVLQVIGCIVLSALGLAVVVVLVIFIVAALWLFYEIFIRQPDIDQSLCNHENVRYTDSHPDKPFTCMDCKKLL